MPGHGAGFGVMSADHNGTVAGLMLGNNKSVIVPAQDGSDGLKMLSLTEDGIDTSGQHFTAGAGVVVVVDVVVPVVDVPVVDVAVVLVSPGHGGVDGSDPDGVHGSQSPDVSSG